MDEGGFKVDDHESDENMALDKIEQNINEGPEFVLSHGAEWTTPDDESSRLKKLDANVRNQDDLERDIGLQADRLLVEQADERDSKRLGRAVTEKKKLEARILLLHQRISQPIGTAARVRLQTDIQKLESRITSLESDINDIEQRIEERHHEQDSSQVAGSGRMPNESRRDYLIRTGKITPFSKMSIGPKEGPLSSLRDTLIDAEDERDEVEALEAAENETSLSHRNLQLPGFTFDDIGDTSLGDLSPLDRPLKRRKLIPVHLKKRARSVGDSDVSETETPSISTGEDRSEEYIEAEDGQSDSGNEEEYLYEDVSNTGISNRAVITESGDVEDLRGVDDGNEKYYQTRLERWVKLRSAARMRADTKRSSSYDNDSADEGVAVHGELPLTQEAFLPHPTVPDTAFDGAYRLPGDIYPFLFDYQKTGVKWLWELYQQKVGGIIGDEMGLGKTIQVISFLAGLHHSKKLTKPIIVIAPATVMKQWVNEFHRWWPPFRVSILHSSGSGMINVKKESRREDALSSRPCDPTKRVESSRGHKVARKILKRVVEDGHILVTTYSGLQTYASLLIPVEWGCSVLDEGHKIRNPNASITIYCKELRTPHRLILSGTPMQNNLTELWSLFDFIFPMRLGTLVNFRNQFEFPIRQGGYANASNLQVQTAARCAETLKEAINPYLLQRFKVDVAADLPKKSEQVLFCKLTKIQRSAYEAFLASGEMESILKGRRQVLYGVDILRKICNHPDLQNHKLLSSKENYGNPTKSGKMQVVKALLELWRDTGHKSLLFAQHRIMLNILERLIKSLPNFNYRRMDGDTAIQHRQTLVDEFNKTPDIHVFLLTTKVGGLGVNLTGADRVIIYDPDWNPSTDIQARERAWRLGQKREVTIYRLMTAGTIEEKIYHRQIFKQFLTNKILRDPKQRQSFHMSDLYDLFSLGGDGPTETSSLFKDVEVTYRERLAGTGGRLTLKTPGERTAREIEEKMTAEKKDVGRITGVASIEAYQGEPEINGKSSGPDTITSENRLMENIFAQSGVHSALEHDQIVNGKRVIRADPKIIEAEAKRIAADAATELRKAGEVAKSVPIGTPTWTGQFGIAGRPDDTLQPAGTLSLFGGSRSTARRAGAGPSSASILANLAGRSSAATSRTYHSSRSTSSSSATPSHTPRVMSGLDFMTMIRDFLITHGGAVHTQMLIDHFDRYCTTPQRSAEFKEMLKTIATLEKGGRYGRGKWSLKPEYAKLG